MNRLVIYVISLSIYLYYPLEAFSQSDPSTELGISAEQSRSANKIFKTRYATIYYAQDNDIDDFIWRLGGQRFEFSADTGFAKNRVDRIVERVEAILDMQPKNFKINIYLHRRALTGPHRLAFYEHKTRSIHISIDYASDGMVAHEIAHAIINQYFISSPPSKIQEILTQYVDKYLWSDY